MRWILGLTALAAVLTADVPQAQTRPMAIVGARLIDGTGAAPTDESVVVIEGDRIRAAEARARVPIPSNATLLQATGKVLIPGLVDAH